ncbi:hypothetical protein JAAARDRAFT_258291 [Jaapia argillacea MUCL 33604]|uniref:Protein kinase domain-containing protein n=1 Tax=Jaapia argillacea MUCL 33604 TaxID=933084 RepID=A0A067PTT6_9AGAM|nr:hypothetical protein JAAARDRAFT_258291 [Jaapia argillacea MUCL 33604]
MPFLLRHLLAGDGYTGPPLPTTFEPREYEFSCLPHSTIYRVPVQGSRIHFVAVKLLRVDGQDRVGNEVTVSMLRKLAEACASAEGTGICPILSIGDVDGVPAVLTPFFQNGHLLHYLANTPQANRLELAVSAAKALRHLHALDLAHGNVTPENLLIDDCGNVQLSDVQITILMCWKSYLADGRVAVPLAWRYKPLEELSPPDDAVIPYTKAGDVFALGTVIFEMFGGVIPSHNTALIRRVRLTMQMVDIIGSRPSEISDELWRLIQDCWNIAPLARPSIAMTVESLASL